MKKFKKTSVICLFFSLLAITGLTSCADINRPKDYYEKIYTTVDGIDIEFYGKGYGNYGQQLFTHYSTGNIESIFDPNSEISFITSSNDNSSASSNEVYVILTMNRHCNTLTTEFSTEDKSLISSFRISYKNKKGEEVSVASTFKEKEEYIIDADVDTLTFFIRQNKYYSAYHKDESLKNKLANNRFTIKQFIPK